MDQKFRTILFVGGVFVPPYEIISFEVVGRFLTEKTSSAFFGIELEYRKKKDYLRRGIAMLGDQAAVGVFQHPSTEKLIILMTSSVPTDFEVHVNNLTGDSIPDQLKMEELVNREMLLQDIGRWTIGQVLELKEDKIPITISLIQFPL